jgi:CO/xanthine dehydrogenase Mo-binding subunit
MHPEAQNTLSVAETAMAEALNMNPLQWLRKVLVNDDTLNQDNQRPMDTASTRMCLEAVVAKTGFEQKWHAPGARTLPDGRKHGIGISAFNDRHGGASSGRGAVIYMNNDGTANFVTGQSNNQQGSNSVTFANIIAETIGLPFSAVVCSSYGTADQAPDGGSQAGSAGASSNGSACQQAALDIREQMFTYAAGQLKVTVDDLHARNGSIFVKTDPTKTITHAAVMAKITKPIVGVGKGINNALKVPFQGKPAGTTTAAHRQGTASVFEVAVDTETGDVEILTHSHTTDCGRIVDPYQCSGQVLSSLWSQHGKCLMWDVQYDPGTGAVLHQTFLDAKAATSMDINDDVQGGFLTESTNKAQPFGMSGLGEPAAHGSGPAALMNAIYNAIGGNYQTMQRPMTPDKILKHLGKA